MTPEHELVPDTTTFNALLSTYAKASVPGKISKMDEILDTFSNGTIGKEVALGLYRGEGRRAARGYIYGILISG
jgi:hypothetical protein